MRSAISFPTVRRVLHDYQKSDLKGFKLLCCPPSKTLGRRTRIIKWYRSFAVVVSIRRQIYGRVRARLGLPGEEFAAKRIATAGGGHCH
ncbi:hypothetical protein SDJN03_21827, partial [Cucurbita argyrosperma subsp. sororia]